MSLLQSRATISKALEKPGIRSLGLISKIVNPVEWLEANLSVANPGGFEVVSITLQSADGKDAMKVVDAIVEAFVDEVGHDVVAVVQPAVIAN